MSSLTLTFALFLSLVVLVHGDCVIDPSMPCECTNPFLGTDNFFLGDPVKNCNAAKACYVKTCQAAQMRDSQEVEIAVSQSWLANLSHPVQQQNPLHPKLHHLK
eukprot:TRINITY_DN1625_c0_g1_i6.p2 TRINITY_DN1625_c0_g1~~TRINITY_DN1625_c0_g1_i6.p2  ORF type:complete len:104 (-),score=13.62 TRINITY_DN1625_c0_g1_i6:513-824(-)